LTSLGFQFSQSGWNVVQRSPGKGGYWRSWTAYRHPPLNNFLGSEISEGPQILVVTGALLKNTALSVQELPDFVEEVVELGQFERGKGSGF
jgi:hypothetical protein